jgi:hypothetical protein
MSASVRGFDPSQHLGRRCSRDCAEYGCAGWTGIERSARWRRLTWPRQTRPFHPGLILRRRGIDGN